MVSKYGDILFGRQRFFVCVHHIAQAVIYQLVCAEAYYLTQIQRQNTTALMTCNVCGRKTHVLKAFWWNIVARVCLL